MRVTRSRKHFLVLASGIIQMTAAFAQDPRLKTESAFFWFGNCHNMMAIRLVVDGRTAYRSTFPACRMERNENNVYNEARTRAFYFAGGHTFQGTYRTTRSEKVEGNIWQAGADPDGMYLGITFDAHCRVLLNTLHFVDPGKWTQSLLDRGVVIKTYPLKSAQ